MNKIKQAHLKQYKNAEFTAFCISVKKITDQIGTDNLGIQKTDFNQFCNVLTLLNDAVNTTSGSDKTPVINDYDAQRNKYFRNIRNVLANLRYTPDAELYELYETAQTKILSVYPSSITTEPRNSKTAHIKGFIIDVNKYFAAQIDKLGIKSALTALETSNDNFQQSFLDRSEELAQIPTGITTQYRTQLQELYTKMETDINYWASRTDATSENEIMLNDTCVEYTKVLNQYIDELWQSIKLSKSLKDADTTTSNTTNSSATTNHDLD